LIFFQLGPYYFPDPGGKKEKMNLFTAINNALSIALETDPKAVRNE
jgi:hypothetical protein